MGVGVAARDSGIGAAALQHRRDQNSFIPHNPRKPQNHRISPQNPPDFTPKLTGFHPKTPRRPQNPQTHRIPPQNLSATPNPRQPQKTPNPRIPPKPPRNPKTPNPPIPPKPPGDPKKAPKPPGFPPKPPKTPNPPDSPQTPQNPKPPGFPPNPPDSPQTPQNPKPPGFPPNPPKPQTPRIPPKPPKTPNLVRMAEPFGHFSHALLRALPPPGDPRAEDLGVAAPPGPPPDPPKARRQLGVLGGLLRQRLGLQVVELPPGRGGLRAVLLEELLVVQGGTALLTSPGDPRARELGGLRDVLEELQLRVLSLTDEGAALDGGDVLFTGREFFVGISRWTNLRGAEAVADTFRDFTVSTVPVGGGGRLKGFCSMADQLTIAHGSSDGARRAIKAMEQLTDHPYSRLELPDDPAANCLFCRPAGVTGGVTSGVTSGLTGGMTSGLTGGLLVHRGQEEFPRSQKAFQKVPGVSLVPLDLSEVAKVGGALSSCCVLLRARPAGRGRP